MTHEAWIQRYRRAWEAGDPDAAAELFSEECVYRAHPFREPERGRDGVRAYWRTATSTQSDAQVRMGDPVIDGDRVAVEWWATMIDEGEEITLPGCLVLMFDEAGLCIELREYWHLEPRRRDPPDGWGR